MADQQVKVEITANATQASREFDSFGAKVGAISTAIKGTMNGIGSAVLSVQSQFVALGAMLGAGAFVAGVKSQIDLMDATRKSAQAAGVSVQAFREMAYAAELADVEADVLQKSMSKLSNQLYRAAAGDPALQALFGKTLKVDVRDAGGAIRDTDKVLEDLAGRFEELPDGAKKVALAAEIFGEKLGPKLIPFLNQGKAGIIELREELKKLNGELSDNEAAAAEQFNDNMTRAEVASQRLKIQIANEALPTLVEFSNFFVKAAKDVGTLEAAWLTFGKTMARVTGSDEIGQAKSRYADISNEIERIQLRMIGVQNVLARDPTNPTALRTMTLLTGKVRELQAAAMEASAAIARIGADAGNAGGGRGFVNPAAANRGNPKDVTGEIALPGKEKDTRMAQWDAELDAQKVAHERMQAENGTFYDFGKAREAAYWQAILSTLDAADKVRFGVQKKYYGLLLDLRKTDFEAEQAELQTRIAGAKNNYDEQEMLAELFAERARQRYGQDSKEYQQALQQLQQLYRAHIEAKGQIRQIERQNERDARASAVDDLERSAQLELTLGTITQEQLLDVKRRALVMREQIELEAKQAELQAQLGGINDPVAVEKIQAEIAAIKRKYAGLQAQNNGEKVATQAKPFDAVFGTSQQALEDGLNSMVSRMKVTLGGIRDVTRQVGASLLQELAVKPVAAWIASQARMVVMTALFGEQRVAMEAATGAEITAVQGAASLKTIAMKAYEAAAGAYSAIAGIPYVGPVLAPVAAGVALAGVMAFAKNIFSAENGFDIPKGLNPMVQAHSNEMILPSKHADTMRALGDIVASGGSLQGGGGDVILQGTPLPGDFWVMQRSGIIKAVKHAKRNFEI